jgi:hypothetical protein
MRRNASRSAASGDECVDGVVVVDFLCRAAYCVMQPASTV